MKALKLDHDLALMVQKGLKNTTWRLFDDKDLSVEDEVRLIDKVDPGDPETWKAIGRARIQQIVEKRLGDTVPEDHEDSAGFITDEEKLEVFRRHYGPHVTLDTPVKIVHFNFIADKNQTVDIVDNQTTISKELKLYADGGSRGNPGPSSSGFAIMDMEGNIIVKKGIYLGVTTNNQAEYQSLKFGLEEARNLGGRVVHVYMDSLLVINQMLGIFKVKNRDLWPIHGAIKDIVADFARVTFTHVPRELNKIADREVNEVLDKTLKG